MDDHTLQQAIDLAVKTAVLKAKKEAILECRPVGPYFLTETEDDPNVLFGGRWQKLTGRYVLQCSDDSHKAGTTVEAGLPNITGQVMPVQLIGWAQDLAIRDAAGALARVSHQGNRNKCTEAGTDNNSGNGWSTGIKFDASSSNSIYGNSTTVQPPARIVNVWKRVL